MNSYKNTTQSYKVFLTQMDDSECVKVSVAVGRIASARCCLWD